MFFCVPTDSKAEGIVLVLVVVLVLDPWDFGAEKEPDPSAIILFYHSDRETCRTLEHEHEHEHDFSTSAFRLRSTFAG